MRIKAHTRSNKWISPGLLCLRRRYLTFHGRHATGMAIRSSSCLKSCNVLKMALNTYSSGAAEYSTLQSNALRLATDSLATKDRLHSIHFCSSASLQRLLSHICYAIAERWGPFPDQLSSWMSEEDKWQVARLHLCLPKGAFKMNDRSKVWNELNF